MDGPSICPLSCRRKAEAGPRPLPGKLRPPLRHGQWQRGLCFFFWIRQSAFEVLSPSDRALRDHQATVAKPFQKLELFGKGKRLEPLTRGAFAFQNFAHPIAHGLPRPDGSGPRRNLTPNCSHFSSSPCLVRRQCEQRASLGVLQGHKNINIKSR